MICLRQQIEKDEETTAKLSLSDSVSPLPQKDHRKYQRVAITLEIRYCRVLDFGVYFPYQIRRVQILLYTTCVVFEKESQWLIQLILINASFKRLSI